MLIKIPDKSTFEIYTIQVYFQIDTFAFIMKTIVFYLHIFSIMYCRKDLLSDKWHTALLVDHKRDLWLYLGEEGVWCFAWHASFWIHGILLILMSQRVWSGLGHAREKTVSTQYSLLFFIMSYFEFVQITMKLKKKI